MNEIQKILHRNLSDVSIRLCELNCKHDSPWWLIEQGYVYKDSNKSTPKGKEYTKKINKEIESLFRQEQKEKNVLEREQRARKELRQYLIETNDNIPEDELTESEYFAYRYLTN